MRIPKSIKHRIRQEQEKIFEKMCSSCTTKDEWDELNKRYEAYSIMLKPTFKLSPDTIFMGAINILGIVLILNFEKFDIVRSKAIGFIWKGRV